MRRSDLLGLRWTDVDLDAGRLSIVQSMILVDHEIRFTEPKTASSRRSVVLDPRTVETLRVHRRTQREDRLAWGPAWQDSGLVFVREDGSPLHPQRLSTWFHKVVLDVGQPPIRLHDLRHYAAGQPAKVVSERLGHSSIAITLDIYSHVLPSMDEAAAAAIAGAIDT